MEPFSKSVGKFILAVVVLALLLVIGTKILNPKQQEPVLVEGAEGKKAATGKQNRTERNEQYKRETETLEFGMVYVEGGTFTMGCTDDNCRDDGREEPAHRVTVSSFNIGKYEVTQAQWVVVMGSNPSHFKGDNLPVETVSWDDIQVFISKLNGLTGKQYRLPTEAEWEYTARGGNKSQGYMYSGSNTLNKVAWNYINSSSTHPVGTKQPNELGVYDMTGNICEWCSDWRGPYSSNAQTNPEGPTTGKWRVIRDGGWDGTKQMYRASYRRSEPPESRRMYNGFRLVHP